jgi:hypothetical protein
MLIDWTFIFFIVTAFCAFLPIASSSTLSSVTHLPSLKVPCCVLLTQPIRPERGIRNLMFFINCIHCVIILVVSQSCLGHSVAFGVAVPYSAWDFKQDARKSPHPRGEFWQFWSRLDWYH